MSEAKYDDELLASKYSKPASEPTLQLPHTRSTCHPEDKLV